MPAVQPHSRVRDEFDELAGELEAAFAAWRRAPASWPADAFDRLAGRAFALQYEANEPYRRYCDRRGARPGSPGDWRGIPAVPTAAFREIALRVAVREPVLEFRTSGTTGGRRARGRHPIVAPELYRASLLAGFAHGVIDPGPGRLPFLSLVPPFSASRDSSLSWMCDAVVERFGAAGSIVAARAEGFDWAAADRFVERACATGRPVGILATTLGLHEWIGRLERCGARRRLPDGSRVMDTGGAKGRGDVTRSEVVARLEEWLGVPGRRVVNEFGMTELLSQRYSRPPEAPHLLFGPPWLRTRALDPVSLEELPDGEPGVLCHFDLANLGSVCAVLTEDIGRVHGDAIEWGGRAPGAPPRGCSLATAELLEAQSGA